MKKRVGLYFGTFNPIHIGHCVIAQYMLEFTDLDEVWFVVTPHNPYKSKSTLLDDYERLSMVNIAIKDQYKLRASDLEFDLPQPSYTAVTLAHAREKYPDMAFALIMGRDNLETLHKWLNYEQIIAHHKVYVYPRVSGQEGPLDTHPNVVITKAPIMQIASTDIRRAIKKGKNVSYMLPLEVWKYIDENLFYR